MRAISVCCQGICPARLPRDVGMSLKPILKEKEREGLAWSQTLFLNKSIGSSDVFVAPS